MQKAPAKPPAVFSKQLNPRVPRDHNVGQKRQSPGPAPEEGAVARWATRSDAVA